MGKEDDPLLTPYHIISSEQNSAAIKGDIAELITAARQDQRPFFEVIESFEESHAILQMVSIGILTRLSRLGASEAERVLTDMEQLDPENPITNNLSTLASVYDEKWRDPSNLKDRAELRGLAGFSHAAFALAAVAALRSRERTGYAAESSRILPSAINAVHVAATYDLSPESTGALQQLLQEIRANVENPDL